MLINTFLSILSVVLFQPVSSDEIYQEVLQADGYQISVGSANTITRTQYTEDELLHRMPQFLNMIETAPVEIKPSIIGRTILVIDSGVKNMPECGVNVIGSVGEITSSHGTYLASVALNYAPPNSNIISYQITDENNNSDWQSVADALEWAIDNRSRFDIILLTVSTTSQPFPDVRSRLTNLSSLLHSHGKMIISASGRGSIGTMTYPSSLSFYYGVSAMELERGIVIPEQNSAFHAGNHASAFQPAIAYTYDDTEDCIVTSVGGTSVASAIVSGSISWYNNNTSQRVDDLAASLQRSGGTVAFLSEEIRQRNRYLNMDGMLRSINRCDGGEDIYISNFSWISPLK